MIFVLRAILVSLAFFVLLYSLLSLLVLLTWCGLRLCHFQKRISALGLFTLRAIPFAISAAVSLFLTLPSFLLLETHSLDEDLGTFLLGACATLILGTGIYRVLAAEARTRRVVSACLESAIGLERNAVTPTIVLARSITPVMLVGVRAPRILISASACKVLNDGELQAAVRHETAHSRSRDNLKKAILNCLSFPGMASLEECWREASELAADDGAVSSRAEALDLAAALIKLARHFPCQTVPDLATGLMSTVGSVMSRVERLMAWKESSVASSYPWRYIVAGGLIACFALAAKLGPVLVLAHSLTERLVP
jgi:beta-lactamase regulating signal transducer with metallopeptidase domain